MLLKALLLIVFIIGDHMHSYSLERCASLHSPPPRGHDSGHCILWDDTSALLRSDS